MEDRQKEQPRGCCQASASLDPQARKPQRERGVESEAGVPGFLMLSGQVRVGGLSISHTLPHPRRGHRALVWAWAAPMCWS